MKTKSLIILMLTLVLMGNTLVFADSSISEYDECFSIRGGISYHTSKEQVLQIEENNGSAIVDGWEITHEMLFGMKKTDLRYLTTVAGHGVMVFHYFNSASEAESLHYFLTGESYKDIVQALCEKYGEAHFTSKNQSPFDSNILVESYATQRLGKDVHFREYMGWLLKYSNCYVLIEAADTTVAQTVNYKFMSYDEVTQVINSLSEAEASKKNSIENDL